MKISISGIYDRGNIERERVHFRADSDIDLSFFVLFDTSYMAGTQVFAGNHSAFWLGPRPIPRGEHIVVYTRAGNPSTEKKDNGGIYNFIFRGLPSPLYTQPNACAMIMELQTWSATQTTPVPLPPLLPTVNLLSGLGDAFASNLGSVEPNNLGALNSFLGLKKP